MEDLLASQLRATKVLMEAEEKIEEMIKFVSSRLPEGEKEDGEKALREFVKVCISYGHLKCTHENYLSDGKKKP